jgi:hypothetical protein
LFTHYLSDDDFIGADMARKFLQMGYTRSRRYANHKSGKKYDGPVPSDKKGKSGSHGREILPIDPDTQKAQSAEIFYKVWQKAKNNKKYQSMLLSHKNSYADT